MNYIIVEMDLPFRLGGLGHASLSHLGILLGSVGSRNGGVVRLGGPNLFIAVSTDLLCLLFLLIM